MSTSPNADPVTSPVGPVRPVRPVGLVEPTTVSEVGYRLVVPERPNGPIVRFLLRRTAIAGAVLGGAALAVLRSTDRPARKATALGLLAPGAGYVYTRNFGRLATTWAGFSASLVAWFGTGNVLAPPAVWAAAALDARRRAAAGHRTWAGATTAVPVALAAGVGASVAARRRAFRAAQERGRRRAVYLASTPRLDPRPTDGRREELSTEDLATLRGFLDRALQPVDEYAGFDIIDQFQTSAIRYQVNFLQWSLALAQLHWTPAFQGYVSAAQRRLIEKMTEPRVWRYWAYEQTWGNLSLNWDPMARDNIMLSGYLGVMLGMYESNTGDVRYRTPGSLAFRLGRRKWDYDSDKVAEAVHRNMVRSRLTLFPCEPNWVYNMCNMTGINTLLFSDRLHRTSYVESIGDRFRERLHEEFVTADGRVTAIRSARLGFTIPMLTSTLADTTLVTMLHAFDPDLAHRCWAIVRHEFIDTSGADPKIALRGWDAIDTGNYRRGDIGAYAATMWAAAEMGDTELYQQLKAGLDRRYEPATVNGVRWYGGRVRQEAARAVDTVASTQANGILGVARFCPPGGYRAMILDGPGDEILQGPYLEGASYPDVLVARAETDGRDLRLVLCSGTRPGRHRLGLERLAPGARYELRGATGSTATADADGRATIEVDLDGRLEVTVTPLV